MAQNAQKVQQAPQVPPAPGQRPTVSPILDLNDAFVYYVTQLDTRTRGKSIPNLANAVQTDQITLGFAGGVTYDPPIDLAALGQQDTAQIQVLASTNFENDSSVQDSAQFSESETATASFSTAVTRGIKVGAQAKLTTKIPFFAQAELSLSAEASLSSTQTNTSTQSQTFSINTTVNVPPRSRIAASLVISSLQYAGTLTAKIQVGGRLGVNVGSDDFNVQVADVFRAIKAQPPNNFTISDSRGSSFSLKASDVDFFEVTPTGAVLYSSAATIDAKFGASQRVQIRQFDVSSGQMVSQSTL